MIDAKKLSSFSAALPFWSSLLLIPLAWISAMNGGWSLVLLPVFTWYLFAVADALTGTNLENADPETDDEDLFWYRIITIIWTPLQFVTLFGLIWYASGADHLSSFERIVLFFGVGVITGTIGITYSHELMHQRAKL